MIKWLEKNKFVSIILTCLIALEIFYVSSLSSNLPGGKGAFSFTPIIYHFTVFFLFSFFSLITIKGNKKIKVKYIFIAISLSIIYALLDEFHQLFVPFRSSSIQDIFTDTAGIFSAVLIYYKIQKNKICRNK